MKKAIICLLLITACTLVQAQSDQNYRFPPQSDILFWTPYPNYIHARFKFILPKGNQIQFEMREITQLDYLPNLDSIFKSTKEAVSALKDSFKADGLVRRIDYVAKEGLPPKLRVITHRERPLNYTFSDNELVQLKVDSDTLRISFQTETGRLEKWKINDSFQMKPGSGIFYINVILNNLSDVENLPEAILSQCFARVQDEVALYLKEADRTKSLDNYFASFNMTTGERLDKKSNLIQKEYQRKKELIPTIHFGFQYARGSFLPSAAAGMQYVFGNDKNTKNFLRLLWEPYFNFNKSTDGKIQTERNDFITLHFTQIDTDRNFSRLQTTANLSLGFLAGRRGDVFNKNTYKIGFGSFLYGSLLVEPEFFFNSFFKNFSPSLRLVLLFE